MEVDRVLVMPVEETPVVADLGGQVVTAAQPDDLPELVGVPERDIHGVVRAEAASVRDREGVRIIVLREGEDLLQDVSLELAVPRDPIRGPAPSTIDALGVHAIDAEQLDASFHQRVPERVNEPPVLVIVE